MIGVALRWYSVSIGFNLCGNSMEYSLSCHMLSQVVGAVEGLCAAFKVASIGLLGLVAQFMAPSVLCASKDLYPVS